MPFISPDPSPNPPPPIGDISDYGVTVGVTTDTISDWIASLQAGGGGPEAAASVDAAGAGLKLHGCTVARLAQGTYRITLATPRDDTNSVMTLTGESVLYIGAALHNTSSLVDIAFANVSGIAQDVGFDFALYVVT